MERHVTFDLREYGVPEIPAFGWYRYARAAEGLPPHSHPGTMEICYLVGGRQTYRVDGHDYRLQGGDLFVTQPDEIHDTAERPQEKGELFWIQLLLPRRPQPFLACDRADARELVRSLREIPVRHFAGEPGAKRALDEIFKLVAGPAERLQRLAIRARMLDFLLRVLACSRRVAPSHLSQAMRDLVRYIAAHRETGLTLPAMARWVGLSLPRFKARFKQELGVPPAEYVLRARIDHAVELLARPRASITAVAMELGFSSSQYFATVFRRYTGMTPSAFRRRQTAAGSSKGLAISRRSSKVG